MFGKWTSYALDTDAHGKTFYAWNIPTRLTPELSSVVPFLSYGSSAKVPIHLRLIFTHEGSETPTFERMDLGIASEGALVVEE